MVLREIFGAKRVEVNLRPPIALSLPSGSVSHKPLSSLSIPVDCHLPNNDHSFRLSSLPLTLHGRESVAQYVLNVTLV
jgi:hypothetical protein